MGARKRESANRRKEALKTQYFAKLNNVPTSPRKMRLAADMVRGMEAENGELYISTIYVDCAAMLKRLRPAPQGRGYRIRKRSNHVTLFVDTINKNDNKN